jgi:FtsX-like permease family
MIVSLQHLLGWIVSAFRSREDLVLENLALRRQLLALDAKRPHRRFTALHKLFWVTLRTFWSEWRKPLVLVTPRTVVNWHRAGFRLYWKWVAHIVSQRTKEIGIRMALGATTRSVERLVLKQAMRLAVTGGIVGCILALGVSKILSSSLLMINTYDAAAYAGGIAFVWMACGAAAYLPARRVVRVDPASTLRYD